jgi:hypothetical protein
MAYTRGGKFAAGLDQSSRTILCRQQVEIVLGGFPNETTKNIEVAVTRRIGR